MGNSGAEAYRKRLEEAARLKSAGTAGQAGYKLPEGLGPAQEDELREKRRKVSDAAKADYLIRDAMNRGEFDNLQYAGKPIPGLDDPDPDWWIKRLIKRENLTGLGPPALQLRVEDAGFEAAMDRLPAERLVRAAVDDFNARVVDARRQLLGGPPVVTRTRDADEEVLRWRQRRGLPAPVPGQEANPGLPGIRGQDAGSATRQGWTGRLRSRLFSRLRRRR